MPHPFRWEKLYQAAVLETNDALLRERIRVAKDAIVARRGALTNRVEDNELRAVQDALYGLTVLERERVISRVDPLTH